MADEDKNVFILNEELLLKIVGENAGDAVEPVLLDSARRLVIHDLLFGRDPDGNERPVQVESTRELAVSMHGEDPSGDIVGLLTDANQLLRNRPFEPYTEIVVTDLGAAWTVCAENATANSIMKVWVEIWKYHTGTSAAGVDIRFDDGAGGTPVIVNNLLVSAQAPGPKFGPYHLTNGWSIDMMTNIAARCRCVATIEHYGMDAL